MYFKSLYLHKVKASPFKIVLTLSRGSDLGFAKNIYNRFSFSTLPTSSTALYILGI